MKMIMYLLFAICIHKISLLHTPACEDWHWTPAKLQKRVGGNIPTSSSCLWATFSAQWGDGGSVYSSVLALDTQAELTRTFWLSLSGQHWACSWRSSVHLPDICTILKIHAVSGEALRERRNRNTMSTVKLSMKKSGDWIIPICAVLTEETDPSPVAVALELEWSRRTCPLWSQVLCLPPGWQRRIRMLSSSH